MRLLTLVTCFAIIVVGARAADYGIFVRHLRQESTPRTVEPQVLPLPAYPADLLTAAIDGYASLRFLVSADGTVSQVEVVAASQREFVAAARAAVLKWTFARTGPAAAAPAAVWMQCTLVFRASEEDYFPTFGAGFAATRLGGREVLRLAVEQARKEGIDVEQYAGFRGADIFLTDAGHQLRWGVTWQRAGAVGEHLRIWINDATGEAVSERKEKSAPAAAAQ